MRLIDLVKLDLRITDDAHDALLVSLIAEATDEALQFMGRETLPGAENDSETLAESSSSEGDDIAPSVAGGIRLLVRGKFDAADAAEIAGIRKTAETLLTPYRQRWGV